MSPRLVRVAMRPEAVNGCMIAAAMRRCVSRNLTLPPPPRQAYISRPFELPRELHRKMECDRPIRVEWVSARIGEWHGHTTSRPERPQDGRAYRECTSRTWNVRPDESVRRGR